ncbi:MAG TPA: GntR family transcriptional regulator [Methylomirabilota bacterium]|nr:GntR family transcriptional regulator [Methylomirabilota bacterium]
MRDSSLRRARDGGRARARARAASAGLVPSVARHQTLEELAYRDIRRAIVEGRLAPGARVVASAVASAAGISRIPGMQALRRLERDGFVRINPHRDVVVSSLSPADFRERFLLMGALEGLCLREGAARITPALLGRLRALQREMAQAKTAGNAARAVAADSRFHRLLWEASELPQVIQILQNIWDRGEYYRVIMHARRGGFASESLAEHEQILRALEDGEMARAARAIEQHRMRAMERLAETT